MWLSKSEAIEYLTQLAMQYLQYLKGDYVALPKSSAVAAKDVLDKLKAAMPKDVKSKSTPVLFMELHLPVGATAVNITVKAVVKGKEHVLDSYFSYPDSRVAFGMHQTLSVDLSAFAGQDIKLVIEAGSGGIKNYANRRVLHNVRIVDAANGYSTMQSLKHIGFVPKEASFQKNVYRWTSKYKVPENASVKPLSMYVAELETLLLNN